MRSNGGVAVEGQNHRNVAGDDPVEEFGVGSIENGNQFIEGQPTIDQFATIRAEPDQVVRPIGSRFATVSSGSGLLM